jgi:DNA-binding response OmpR family regulator
VSGVDEGIRLLQEGADFYLKCPYDIRELHAYANVCMRKYHNQVTDEVVFQGGTFNTRTGELFTDGATKHLTNSERTILIELSRNIGQIVSKEHLYDALYPLDCDKLPDPKVIDVFINKIRNKLPIREALETTWGRGFRLHPPENGGSHE